MFCTQSNNPSHAVASGSRSSPFPVEASGLLDRVRQAIERNEPDGARAAALRLATVLTTQATEAPAVIVRGGFSYTSNVTFEVLDTIHTYGG